MTAAIAAKLNLKLWRLDFVGAYLNSLMKDDIYMKQPEGFVEPGYEEYVCKLVHTIYGTMHISKLSACFRRLQQTTVVPVVACSACSVCSVCREGILAVQ